MAVSTASFWYTASKNPSSAPCAAMSPSYMRAEIVSGRKIGVSRGLPVVAAFGDCSDGGEICGMHAGQRAQTPGGGQVSFGDAWKGTHMLSTRRRRRAICILFAVAMIIEPGYSQGPKALAATCNEIELQRLNDSYGSSGTSDRRKVSRLNATAAKLEEECAISATGAAKRSYKLSASYNYLTASLLERAFNLVAANAHALQARAIIDSVLKDPESSPRDVRAAHNQLHLLESERP